MALAACLVPVAECLETVKENMAPPVGRPDPARKQLPSSEVHLGLVQLHLATAQRYQEPVEERGTRSETPPVCPGVQLVEALNEAQDFEATASEPQTSKPQASWMREAIRRTACISYLALEACKMVAQAGWSPQVCNTYQGLLNREEERIYMAFGDMIPNELPSEVAKAARTWLVDAYDNIQLAEDRLAAQSREEEESMGCWKDTQSHSREKPQLRESGTCGS
jgi:hypothetical protein